VIAQQLLKRADGMGRIAAVEILSVFLRWLI
jgi:Tfp pilus assembly ATPase PilU